MCRCTILHNDNTIATGECAALHFRAAQECHNCIPPTPYRVLLRFDRPLLCCAAIDAPLGASSCSKHAVSFSICRTVAPPACTALQLLPLPAIASAGATMLGRAHTPMSLPLGIPSGKKTFRVTRFVGFGRTVSGHPCRPPSPLKLTGCADAGRERPARSGRTSRNADRRELSRAPCSTCARPAHHGGSQQTRRQREPVVYSFLQA